MLFYTPEFLIFSLVLLATLAVFHRDTPRKIILLLFSYFFYMWWNPAFIFLILFATGVNYFVGLGLARTEDDSKRKILLASGLIASLGLLAYFKYAGFLSENLLYLMREMGGDIHWTSLEVTLPVGISFYTFQTLSYTIDVYRKQIPETRSALDFALFVAFFPQLVAGPIVRAADFLPQLMRPIRVGLDQAGFFLILRGLAKKILIADNIASLADHIFETPEAFPSFIIWIGAVCFAIQIYCDFSGYSDIAIGISRGLGFHLPDNFDHPYVAQNPSDFWRRWHISLSSWLRDYLYISMGGNRSGNARTYFNLMMTMLLGGLWHGASWNFVLWGFIHGFILVVHRFYQKHFKRSTERTLVPNWIAATLSVAAMQYFVLMAWIAFRVTDIADLKVALSRFIFFDFNFQLANTGLGAISLFSTLFFMGFFLLLHVLSWRVGHADRFLGRVPLPIACAVCVVAGLAACLFWPLNDVPFLYFQF
jgi:alginate O-acetyltransferase complex protein AlgI